jgi:hypothetical protein
MGGNVLLSPEEPTILASVTEFPLLREFRERAPRTGAPEHSTERVAAEVREAWVRSDSAALHTAGRRLFRSPGASGLAREALALGDLAAGRLGPPPTGMSVPWAADPLLWLAPHLVPELLGEDFGTYRTCAALLERLRSRGFPEGRGDDRALRGEQGGQDTSGRAPPATLGQLTSSAVVLGRWSAATDHAAEGLALARLGGHAIEVAGLLARLAWIAAARGRVADCRRLAAEADAIATPKGCTLITAIIKWALGLLDLTLGHPGVRAGPAGAAGVLERLDPGPAVGHGRPGRSGGALRPAGGGRAAAGPARPLGGAGGPGVGPGHHVPLPRPARHRRDLRAARRLALGRAGAHRAAGSRRFGAVAEAMGYGRTTGVPAPIGGVASGRRRGDAAELQGAGQCPPRRHSTSPAPRSATLSRGGTRQ